MSPILRNILAVVAGVITGSVVNMLLISVSSLIIPPPEGIDTSTMEGLKAALPLFGPEHFLMPFLAHALGTLVGAFITAWIAVRIKLILSLAIGCFFLAGGIMNVVMLDSPPWFTLTDLLLAYLPIAWLGYYINSKIIK